jgi:pSer/pThr/pTyr-binding forkhead associated (FHA) protein
MIESGQILPLADRTEFTLGRSAEGQPIVPDVDLSPHNAYANGVSRLHAVLKLIQDHIVIMDLGSSNGTYLNGNRLQPYIETTIAHGDVIYLGKLKIQVLIE